MITRDYFIKISKEIHNEKYDYSKVIYINCKSDVCIICPIHGKFNQNAESHYNGKGCRQCSNGKRKKNYDDIINDAKKCETLKEFKSRFYGSYLCAYKYGYIDNFTWLNKRVSPNYWTKDRCYCEAKKYNTFVDFKNKNQYVYNFSIKKGYIEDYDWLNGRILLTKEECEYRSKKYNTVVDFNKNEPRSYQASNENGWISEFYWLSKTIGTKQNPMWTLDSVLDECKKYTSRNDFKKKCCGGYDSARKNGWMDILPFPKFIIDEPVYSVYVYEFVDQNTVYVGLTHNKKNRNDEHNGLGRYSKSPEKSKVYKFSKDNNLNIPEIIIKKEKLTSDDAQEFEHETLKYYIDNGWNILNIGKTGKRIGSLGNHGIKWTKEKCYEEAMKYKYSGDFYNGSNGAYMASHNNKWHKEYEWLITGNKVKNRINR